MTNNDARGHFLDCGLSYADIGIGELLLLQTFLFMELEKSSQQTSGMTLNYHKTKFNVDKEKGLIVAFFFVDGSYYKQRECISFNRDGFIGFAGWADSNNVAPIHRAFVEWCDEIKSRKLSG
jgi:hypothetical protein